jgi:very-short-patch-repair endonuclease
LVQTAGHLAKTERGKVSDSKLEDLFAFQLDALGLTGYVREYPAIPGRKFRYDFAFVKERLLVEVNGGTYAKGAHSTGQGIARDYEKIRLGQDCGWKVYPFDGKAIKSGEAVEVIRQALEINENSDIR